MPPRPARYSAARRRPDVLAAVPGQPGDAAASPPAAPVAPAATPAPVSSPGRWWRRHPALLVLLALLLAANLWQLWQPGQRPALSPVTPRDVQTAVLRALQEQPRAADAADAVVGSLVRVVGFGVDAAGEEYEQGVGSGVVIVDDGTILTNLHVVLGAQRVLVTFFDGTQGEALIEGVQPENDLAVLRARAIPDDLQAASLRSTRGLRPGDAVLAVGFPFGIGPSVSAGVISGLERSFAASESQQELHHLIQFDAAANPGNSGGPLITLEGEVVGIVTAILNPGEARTFAGIGFAVPIENAAAAAGLSPF